MRSLCVDLAAKFSAAMVVDGSEVLTQFDSRGLSAFDLWKKIRHVADEYEVDFIGVEDVPIAAKWQVERAFRLQGIGFAICWPYLERLILIQPNAWQKHWPGTGSVPKAVKAELPKSKWDAWREENMRLAALSLGYEPPDLVGQFAAAKRLAEGEKVRILVKDTKILAKSMTDYVAARLISDFCQKRGLDTLLQTSGCTLANI